ncbi:uncharacterized protein BCR38DRAFT_414699 [Pseudomassariella vexata]|uniref:Lipase B n=1 Tax=Pseudomassariella vexata TaxID=1141098 RepID=A0A1Y2D9A0_9PEZI|nr:uncharacterized protein BCR38DRAFT_414699 [Pseudomassariella vexata]ORY55839.1 hypothetical protein BCR38DRAFT_414699 [Pseudomassariella vexata]
MRIFTANFVLAPLLLGSIQAAPAPTEYAAGLEARGLLKGISSGLKGLLPAKDIGSLLDDITDPQSVLSVLEGVEATAAPNSIQQAQSTLQAIYSATPTNLYKNVAKQIQAGLGPSKIHQVASDLRAGKGENCQTNHNPINPREPIYPKKSLQDAPYSLSEEKLRGAIFIPPNFTYGQKPPTVFVPGSGSYGSINFASNLGKLLTNVPYADPVYLNIPGAMLDDAQLNSEYIAYAINYISSITRRKDIAVISWSQGGLDVQWVFTFWPSTRQVVTDLLAVSPDFHGTVFANLLCFSSGSVGLLPCDPSVIQQEYNSNFVNTLRGRGGDSAYVPTTTFYSAIFDEIVEPQQGIIASAYLQDARRVGVTNVELQSVCFGRPAGSFYGHAGVLYNPLTYALIVDALTHDGPGTLERIDLGVVCARFSAPGLTLVDDLATIGLIPIAAVLLLAYPEKLFAEPELKPYARA